VTTPTISPEALGRQLYDLERRRQTRSPITSEVPEMSPAEAYSVQAAYARLRKQHGAEVAGRKIGLTSKAMQELFGITEPDYGHVFDDMVVGDGGDVALDDLIQPMVEIEIAFWLLRDLRGPGVDAEKVMEATETVSASIEIIDSRIEGWDISFADTVADNGSSARCVLGPRRVPTGELDLANVTGELWRNGELLGSALGSAVMGDPVAAVVWLANAIAQFDDCLRAGEFVLSGALMGAVGAERGDHFQARFGDLGDVSCRFV
jgi:2-keto-4-pentenoate hydratase